MSSNCGNCEGLANFCVIRTGKNETHAKRNTKKKKLRNFEMKPHIQIVYMWRILNLKLVFIVPTAHIHSHTHFPSKWLFWVMMPHTVTPFPHCWFVIPNQSHLCAYLTAEPKKKPEETSRIIVVIIVTMYECSVY